MKERFMKNGVFSLEYDKETLKDMVLTLQEENKQLKDNWSELKKFIGECLEAINIIQKSIGNAIENYTPRILTYKQILYKMQELEKESDSNE